MGISGIVLVVIRNIIVPPTCLFILYAAGLMLKKRYPRLGNGVSTGAIMILFALGTHVGSSLLVRPLESLSPPLASTQGSGAQAIVVLSAGRLEEAPEYGGTDIPDYIAMARIRYAAKLYRETQLPVLVSGGFGIDEGFNETLAAGMARVFQQDYAIPVKWQEDGSTNTAENAIYSAKLLKQAGIKRILLVTDAMHMRRAELAFQQQGMQVVAAPTMFFGRNTFELASLLPSVEGWRRSYYAIYELLGLALYKIRFAMG